MWPRCCWAVAPAGGATHSWSCFSKRGKGELETASPTSQRVRLQPTSPLDLATVASNFFPLVWTFPPPLRCACVQDTHRLRERRQRIIRGGGTFPASAAVEAAWKYLQSLDHPRAQLPVLLDSLLLSASPSEVEKLIIFLSPFFFF